VEGRAAAGVTLPAKSAQAKATTVIRLRIF
jgi:hypothetical protein